jgi:hypothetical protein
MVEKGRAVWGALDVKALLFQSINALWALKGIVGLMTPIALNP